MAEKEKRRRAKGEGTVRKRTDGRWEGRLGIADGQVKYYYGKTQREVKDALAYAQQERAGKMVMLDLDEERYQKVRAQAERHGLSVEEVILRAIDRLGPPPLHVRRALLDAIYAAPPMDLPEDPADLRRELDEAHERYFARDPG